MAGTEDKAESGKVRTAQDREHATPILGLDLSLLCTNHMQAFLKDGTHTRTIHVAKSGGARKQSLLFIFYFYFFPFAFETRTSTMSRADTAGFFQCRQGLPVTFVPCPVSSVSSARLRWAERGSQRGTRKVGRVCDDRDVSSCPRWFGSREELPHRGLRKDPMSKLDDSKMFCLWNTGHHQVTVGCF